MHINPTAIPHRMTPAEARRIVTNPADNAHRPILLMVCWQILLLDLQARRGGRADGLSFPGSAA